MTKADYAQYQADVAAFFKRENIRSLSPIVTEEETTNESYISKQPCECCGDRDFGMRQDYCGRNQTTGEINQFAICDDCVYYTEYGQLDDMQMMEIAQSPD